MLEARTTRRPGQEFEQAVGLSCATAQSAAAGMVGFVDNHQIPGVGGEQFVLTVPAARQLTRNQYQRVGVPCLGACSRGRDLAVVDIEKASSLIAGHRQHQLLVKLLLPLP